MSGDEICNFVFQHQYHQNWVTYSDKESEILNKAVKKGEKTVNLPNKDEKKKITVYLDQMFQLNLVSSVKQPIRCLIYNSKLYSWLFKDDNVWKSYKPWTVFFLEAAYQRKEKFLTFCEEHHYLINLEKFIQVNKHTDSTTSLLREEVEVVLPLKQFNSLMKNAMLKRMCLNESVNFEKSCIDLPAFLSTCNSCELESSKIPNDSLIVKEDKIFYECNLTPDRLCPERNNFQIYCEEGSAFSATLSLSSIMNSNIYFILQLLKHNTKDEYAIFTRGGRVGSKGRANFKSYQSCILAAKKDFEKEFYKRTKNHWSNKTDFIQQPEKYHFLDIDLTPDEKINGVPVDLDPLIESLLAMICDREKMSDHMRRMSFDSANIPAGKLTLHQIQQGYIALNKIAQAAANDKKEELESACDEFYTKIPHDFGQECPPIIKTQKDIEKKLLMLESLTYIRMAIKKMNHQSDAIEHPLNRYYNSLNYVFEPLYPSSNEYTGILQYLENTHGPTLWIDRYFQNYTYELEVIDIFKCHQKELASFIELENKILLWHGSQTTHFAGILSQGLLIPPPEAPHASGDMFGKGLYFADASTKSAKYCGVDKWRNKGLLLICEVSIGNQLYLTQPDESLPKSLPVTYHSVFSNGKFTPKGYEYGVLSSEAKVPIGPLVKQDAVQTSLDYNEYVVYNPNLVKIRYLLKVHFTKFKRDDCQY